MSGCIAGRNDVNEKCFVPVGLDEMERGERNVRRSARKKDRSRNARIAEITVERKI